MNLQHVAVGDTVVRLMGGATKMRLLVSEVDDKLIHCGEHTFEREHGCEYDPELHWQSQWGASGSSIIDVVKNDAASTVLNAANSARRP
jgi:hypothetical protein